MDFFNKLTSGGVTWYYSNKALNKTQRQELADHFGFYTHHVDSTEQGKTPRPKITANKKYIYFVLHIPYQPKNSSRFSICDLNVFITRSALITIESQGALDALTHYFETTKKSKTTLERRFRNGPANLFLNILIYILSGLEKLLDLQGEKIDALNHVIFHPSQSRKFIEEISRLRYNQIVAYSALEKQTRMFEAQSQNQNPLERHQLKVDYKWNVVMESFQTLTYELAADIEHLEGLVKTFETLVTHRTNETIKILTIFSVILLPLTLISGIFGMNFVIIPGSEHPFGFVITVLLMLLIALTLTLLFKLKRWL